MVGGSLQVLRLLPPLKLLAMIELKVTLSTKDQSINHSFIILFFRQCELFQSFAHYLFYVFLVLFCLYSLLCICIFPAQLGQSHFAKEYAPIGVIWSYFYTQVEDTSWDIFK
jgi:hypothetical protein